MESDGRCTQLSGKMKSVMSKQGQPVHLCNATLFRPRTHLFSQCDCNSTLYHRNDGSLTATSKGRLFRTENDVAFEDCMTTGFLAPGPPTSLLTGESPNNQHS